MEEYYDLITDSIIDYELMYKDKTKLKLNYGINYGVGKWSNFYIMYLMPIGLNNINEEIIQEILLTNSYV